jgi:serine/threonine-protein kinase Chk2
MSPKYNDPHSSQGAGEYSQTQRFSQTLSQIPTSAYEVPNEERDGVWGYLVPVDGRFGSFEPLVMKDRSACTPDLPNKKEGGKVSKKTYSKQEKKIEKSKENGTPSRGYLLGRHPECGKSTNG